MDTPLKRFPCLGKTPTRVLLLGLCLAAVFFCVFSDWTIRVKEHVWEKGLQASLLHYVPSLNFSNRQLQLQQFLSSNHGLPHGSTEHPTQSLHERETNLLPATVVVPSAWVKYTDKWHGLTLPVITCEPRGRLGNIMGGYATMYAVGRHYNATVVVLNKMKDKLSKLFPKTSLPDLTETFVEKEWKKVGKIGSVYNYAPVELAAAGLLGPHRFLLTDYPVQLHVFNPFKRELLKEFTFASTYATEAHSFLSHIIEIRRSRELPDPVFIGFHIRRTDYTNHLRFLSDAPLPDTPYYNRALDHYRTKFPGTATFIVASDNYTFAKTRLEKHEDVFFSTGISPGHDMSLLNSCNHTIITVGSFGFWCGYLAGGEVVFPDIQEKMKREYRFTNPMYEKAGLEHFTPLPAY